MLTVGLTGGIGAGKSTVSALLGSFGARIVDADLIARQVVEPGSDGLARVVARFGAEILAADGTLDRAALGRRVFAEPAQLQDLNGIVHPLVAQLTAAMVAEAERAQTKVLVHDVPLLVENGLQGTYDVVLVVDTPVSTQLDRLVAQRGMTAEDAQARIDRQATREQRLAVADEVIVNDGPPEQIGPQVEALWRRLMARSDPPG